EVTRLFSKVVSADWLVGVRPSALSVANVVRIVVSSPIVVPEALRIAWTSVRRVCWAADSVEFDEEEVVDTVLEWVIAVLEALATCAAPWSWWNPPMWDRTVRSSRASQVNPIRRDRRGAFEGEAGVFQGSLIVSTP